MEQGNHRVVYTLDELKERLSFHQKRKEELEKEKKNKNLQVIHEKQIERFEKLPKQQKNEDGHILTKRTQNCVLFLWKSIFHL